MQLRSMTLYSIFIRNFGGTFKAVEADLKRIRDLGVDAIWLLPIHPIGTAKDIVASPSSLCPRA